MIYNMIFDNDIQLNNLTIYNNFVSVEDNVYLSFFLENIVYDKNNCFIYKLKIPKDIKRVLNNIIEPKMVKIYKCDYNKSKQIKLKNSIIVLISMDRYIPCYICDYKNYIFEIPSILVIDKNIDYTLKFHTKKVDTFKRKKDLYILEFTI